tara:strand:- start:143 stop:322 length:180 start_codon:yes stop_codon:yes gene_type:complete
MVNLPRFIEEVREHIYHLAQEMYLWQHGLWEESIVSLVVGEGQERLMLIYLGRHPKKGS